MLPALAFGVPMLKQKDSRCCTSDMTSFSSSGAVSVKAVVGSDLSSSRSSVLTSSVTSKPAVGLGAELLANDVYHSDANIQIAARASGNLDGSPLPSAVPFKVTVTVAGNPPSTKSFSLQKNGNKGWLGINAFSVPSLWFSTTQDTNATVTVELPGTGNVQDIGSVVLRKHSEPAPTDFGDAKQRLSLKLPAHNVFAGESVTLDVVANTKLVLKGFEVDLEVDRSALEMTSITVVNAPGTSKDMLWIESISNINGFAQIQNFRCAACDSVPDKRGAGSETLFRVTVRVKNGASAGAYTIKATVKTDADAKSNNAMSSADTGAPALLHARGGIALAGVGSVHVVHEVARGIFSHADGKVVIVNTAVFNGVAVSRNVQVTQVSNRGRYSTITGVKCESSDDGVMKASPDCSQVKLTAAESGGAAKLTITYTSATFTTEQHFRVYYPEIPVSVSLVQAKPLKRIEGWNVSSVPGDCSKPMVPKYQHTAFSAVALFKASKGARRQVRQLVPDPFEVDVTHMMKQVAVDTLTVARITTKNSGSLTEQIVQGVGAGTSKLVITDSSGKTIGEATITVSNEPVTMTGLLATAVKPMFTTAGSTQEENAYSVTHICAAVPQKPVVFSFEREQAQVVAVATFSDGGTMHITRDEGLRVASLYNNSVIIQKEVYVAVPVRGESSAYKSQATASLHPECAAKPVAEACVYFTVDLPSADSAKAIPSATKLTVPKDAANAAGVPTELSLQVKLIWNTPARQENVEKDPRTRVDLRDAGGRLKLVQLPTGGIKLQVVPGAQSGIVPVYVSFDHHSVTTNFTVTIVKYQRFIIPVTPYPAFKYDPDWGKPKVCKSPVDLVFLLDGSGSIEMTALGGAPGNFKNVILKFVKQIIDGFDIGDGDGQTRVAVATYSTDAEVNFNFDKHTDKAALLAAIDGITYPTGGTYTADGLALVRDQFLPERRPGARSVVILLTDGAANDQRDVPGVAKMVRDRGTEIYSLGVKGATPIPFAELAQSASSPSNEYVFEATFAQLQGLVDRIKSRACTTNFDATMLSQLTCTTPQKYEQAKVGCDMILSDGSRITGLEKKNAKVTLEAPASGTATVSILKELILTPNASGTSYVHCEFGTEKTDAKTRREMILSDAPIPVKTIDTFTIKQGSSQLSSSRALKGKVGRDTASASVSVTLENGRKYMLSSPFDNDSALPGVFEFETNEASSATVDNSTGIVSIAGNSVGSNTITAKTSMQCGAVSKTSAFPVNLDPVDAGDIDLGQKDGRPFVFDTTSTSVAVDLRIHTNGQKLGAFRFFVSYGSANMQALLDGEVCVGERPKCAVQQRATCSQLDVTISPDGHLRVFGACAKADNAASDGTPAANSRWGAAGKDFIIINLKTALLSKATLTGYTVKMKDATSGDDIGVFAGTAVRPFVSGDIATDGKARRGRRELSLWHARSSNTGMLLLDVVGT